MYAESITNYQIILATEWDWPTLKYIDSFKIGFSETVAENCSIWHSLKLTELTTAYRVLRKLYPNHKLTVERCRETDCYAETTEIFAHE